MDQQMTAMDRIEAIGNVLDKLGDIPAGGKLKCGYIWIISDLLNGLRNDILIYEDKIKVLGATAKADPEKEPEVKLEIVPDEEQDE